MWIVKSFRGCKYPLFWDILLRLIISLHIITQFIASHKPWAVFRDFESSCYIKLQANWFSVFRKAFINCIKFTHKRYIRANHEPQMIRIGGFLELHCFPNINPNNKYFSTTNMRIFHNRNTSRRKNLWWRSTRIFPPIEKLSLIWNEDCMEEMMWNYVFDLYYTRQLTIKSSSREMCYDLWESITIRFWCMLKYCWNRIE